MPLPLTVYCFSKIQIGFTFLVPAHLGSPGKGSLNRCVCVTLKGVTQWEFRKKVAEISENFNYSQACHTNTWTHMPHRITVCLPPGTCDIPTLNVSITLQSHCKVWPTLKWSYKACNSLLNTDDEVSHWQFYPQGHTHTLPFNGPFSGTTRVSRKPEATAIGITVRRPLENNLNVWWAQVLSTEI